MDGEEAGGGDYYKGSQMVVVGGIATLQQEDTVDERLLDSCT